MNTVIRYTDFAPHSRILVVSDIHGHADLLRRLLRKADYRPGEDYLILLGDLIEKGEDSLGVLRAAMRLSTESPRVTVMMGNNDLWRLEQLIEPTPERDEILLHTTAAFTRYWGNSTFAEMCAELGIPCPTLAELPAVRRAVLDAFAPEIEFWRGLPTVLSTPQYLFVHGGLPYAEDALETLREKNAYTCLKYDNFRGDLAARHAAPFSRPVIVGHWPVSLYRREITDLNPLIDRTYNVISIDGGCGLQRHGQLNLLILSPDAAPAHLALDDLPTVAALDDQTPSPHSVSLLWGDNTVSRLPDAPAERPGYAWCAHTRTGRQLWIPEDDLYTQNSQLFCHETTDYALPVRAGDRLALVKEMPDAILVKRDGVVGWYYGRWQR